MKKVLVGMMIFAALLCQQTANAANAAPVSIASLSVSGTTVTVNANGHGLSAAMPTGFCITGSSVAADNVCGVVTAATANAFTFTASGLAACAASCGTVLPAKKIIWLATQTVSGGYQVSYLLWIATTSGVAGHASAWTAASQAENNALAAGTFIEVQRNVFFPGGTSATQAQSQMVLDWTQQQSLQTASVPPGAFYGDYYDTGWLQ